MPQRVAIAAYRPDNGMQRNHKFNKIALCNGYGEGEEWGEDTMSEKEAQFRKSLSTRGGRMSSVKTSSPKSQLFVANLLTY